MAVEIPQGDDTEMNMTPMIDIVFNLLIFFMVVTDLTQQELANLVLPLAHTAVQDKDNDKGKDSKSDSSSSTSDSDSKSSDKGDSSKSDAY